MTLELGADAEPRRQDRRNWGRTAWRLALPAIPGLLVFFALFRRTLNPFNVAWLFAPTDFTYDAGTSALGWLYYSVDSWHWPVTVNPDYGGNVANSLMFSDSVPMFSFALKGLLGAFLGARPSQTLGLSILICLILQSATSYLLIRRWTPVVGAPFFGAFFFVSAPALLLTWNITSLFWQWLVVLGLLVMSIYLPARRRVAIWAGLMLLSTGISAYITAMLAVMAMADLVLRRDLRVGLIERALGLMGVLAAIPIGLYLWGAFEIPLGAAKSTGLGDYSANALALLDSEGLSRFLRALPGGTGGGEGFGFVGAGVLALLIAGSGVALNRYQSLKDVPTALHSGLSRPGVLPIAVSSSLLFLAAMLPTITWGTAELQIALPGSVLTLFEVFRANGRFVWPVMYVLILVSVVLGSRVTRRGGGLVIALLLAIQLTDQVPTFRLVTGRVNEAVAAVPAHYEEIMDVLDDQSVEGLAVVPAFPHHSLIPWRELGWAAFNADLAATSYGYFNRKDEALVAALREAGESAIRLHQLEAGTLYVVDRNLYEEALAGWGGAMVVLVLDDNWLVVRSVAASAGMT